MRISLKTSLKKSKSNVFHAYAFIESSVRYEVTIPITKDEKNIEQLYNG